jgi:hypothetical protein|tara:strand:+ start:232 stop:825 length:594 start_codon:yes stop_codon:yes gene_type:complete
MKQQIKISKVKGNPNNPRIIKNDKFKKLVKSIQEFPEMLKLRPIVVDEDMMVLGGNMRLKASKDAGLKEVWIEIAEGLTEEQKKEFIVKDNVGFGDWDWAALGNEWDSVQLTEWGLGVWQNEDDIETSDVFSLPDGDKSNIEQITYTLSSEQSNIIKQAVQDVKHTEEYKYVETFGNENGNGNALYLLITQWVEQKK